jgi:hypothetical protein
LVPSISDVQAAVIVKDAVVRLLLGALVLVTACSTADASPPSGAHPKASLVRITPAPPQTPVPATSFTPSPNFTGGRVVRFDGPRLVLQTWEEDRQIEVQVELGQVRSVWRETEVRLSALETGDELMVAGTSAGPLFYARDIWANIGRMDGVITGIRGETIELDQLTRSGATVSTSVTLSPFIQQLGPWRMSDLRAGMLIGAVVYRAKDGSRRITRIWSS